MDQQDLTIIISKDKQFTFQPLKEKDIQLLFHWFAQPHVAQWWPTPKKEEKFFEHFLPRIRSKNTLPFLVLLNNVPLGYIQYYHITDQARQWFPILPKETVGIDQFIGEATKMGKGLGTAFIKEFVHFLFEQGFKTVIVDPDPKNKQAIKCYQKVGFKKIGIYTTPHEPALLMQYNKK